MLALFSHFFALGRLLRGSGAFFAHVGRFFRVSGRSGSNFGPPGHNFGGSETSFFDVWAHAQVCNARQLLMRKNHDFSEVFAWFLHIASFALRLQNDAKSVLEPVEQSFLQRLCCKHVLGRILGGFGALWGVTWPAFVRSWAAPGLSWVLLGRLLNTSWALLAVSWLLWGDSAPHFGAQDRPRLRF